MAHYHSFLLRIWRSVGEGGEQWTAKLVQLQSGESMHADPDQRRHHLCGLGEQ
ncbi:MAG TPA: hypothetical protein VHB98_22435 [Chloroflexota bacterium]|nr:hypothetical protein [Chloroflexota bacterium]